MNKAGLLKNMRSRSFGARILLFLQPAFILSIFISCLCGPMCSEGFQGNEHTQSVDVENAGCCPSCAPVEKSTEAGCSDESGCRCCLQDQGDFSYEHPEYEVHFTFIERAEIIVELTEPPVHSLNERPPQRTAPQGPPPYLLFESFLI